MPVSPCGGTVTTNRVNLSKVPRQLVSSDENRTRVTILADSINDAPVYIVANASEPWQQGFPLMPGAAYEFTDRGARTALYGVGPNSGDKIVYVITEGA